MPDVLSTDEDEINEENDDYLEALQERIKKKNAALNIVSEIKVSSTYVGGKCHQRWL